MKRWFFVLTVILLVIDCSSQTVCSYGYRRRITFNAAQVIGSNDLVNFPVMIRISGDPELSTVTTIGGKVTSTSGYDIIFAAADGVTLLSFDLEKYVNTTGELIAWVKVPLLSTTVNTHIYMYYGNSSVTTNQANPSAVWADYYAVWHFQGGSMNDASGNGYTATNYSTTTTAGHIGDGRSNSGAQWVELTSFPNLTGDFSISAWAVTNNSALAGQRIFCDDANNTGGYAFSIGDAGTGSLRFITRGTSPVNLDAPNNSVSNALRFHVAATINTLTTQKKIHVNGIQVASGTYTGSLGTDAGNASISGEIATATLETTYRLFGFFDEVRICKRELTSDWLRTEYNNQVPGSSFYTVSPAPDVFIGGPLLPPWPTTTAWASGVVPAAGADVIINNACFTPTASAVYLNSIWIRPGKNLLLGTTGTLQVGYDVLNCGSVNFNATNTMVELKGSNTTTPQQYLSGTPAYTISNLRINNTHSLNPTVSLSNSITVTAALTLSSGVLQTTSSKYLILLGTASSSSGSPQSYVEGPMRRQGTTDFIFPLGKGGRWQPLGITTLVPTAPAISTEFIAEYFSTAPPAPALGAPLTDVSKIEYWDLTSVSGNAKIALYWGSATGSGIDNCADLTVARYSAASFTWYNLGAITSTASSCTGSGSGVITTTANGSFFYGLFTFGSKSSTLNPLPIELIDFEANCEKDGLRFSWTTASEQNADYFNIEYSSNGDDWTEIARLNAAGNSATKQHYEWFQTEWRDGYYQLVQVDRYGHRQAYKTLSQSCSVDVPEYFSVHPNPCHTSVRLGFRLKQALRDLHLNILDQHGRVCFQKTVQLAGGYSELDLDLPLPKGVYVIKASSATCTLPSKKLVVE